MILGNRVKREEKSREGSLSYFRGVICVAVSPNQLQIIFEFAFRLVRFLLDLLQHCLKIHWVCNNCGVELQHNRVPNQQKRKFTLVVVGYFRLGYRLKKSLCIPIILHSKSKFNEVGKQRAAPRTTVTAFKSDSNPSRES
jgi:hypothetical protein